MKPEDHTLYEADCLDLLPQWEAGCVDPCITDPPYPLSKKNGPGWAFSSHVTMSETWDIYSRLAYLAFRRAWLEQVSQVVKPNAQPNNTCRTLTESTEYVIWACHALRDQAKGWVFDYALAKQLNGGKQMRKVWRIPYLSPAERQYSKHPSQKVLNIITRIMLIATRPGELVLDCFGGCGTTRVVAQSFDRRWAMIENNPAYAASARQRLDNVRVPPPDGMV